MDVLHRWVYSDRLRQRCAYLLFFCILQTLLWIPGSLADEIRIRDMKAPCGFYVVPQDNTSTGLRVADLTDESLRSYLLSDPALDDKVIYAVGTPLYGKRRKAVLNAARMAFEEYELSTPLRVINRPQNALERMRFIWFMPEDFQRPTRDEISTGMTKTVLTGTPSFVFLLATQTWIIAIPAATVNFLQSTVATFLRRALSNWQSRSFNKGERFLKQMILSVIFTSGIYFAAHWQELGHILTLDGQLEMIKTVYASVLFQTLWRALFHNGVYAWENTMTDRGRDVDGRRTAARLEMLASAFTTPFWIYSSMTKDVLFDLFGIMNYNVGHLGMTVTAAVGTLIWSKPRMLDPMVNVLDKVFNGITGFWIIKSDKRE